MGTLIVTGGAGFIGCNFVRHALAHTADRVVVVDKLTYSGHLENLQDVVGNPHYELVQADIADRPAMEALLRRCRPWALVNFAAETHVDRSIDDPRPFIETNLTGTYVLLDVVRRHLAEWDPDERAGFRFLHVSTDEVYGTLGQTGLFTEATAYAPNSPYAASKAGADHLVRAYHHTYGLPTLVTNCSNNYGPYQYPEKLIPLMVLNAMEAKPLPIYGDGGNVRDWLYVEDHCAGILEVLRSGWPGQSYNIGGNSERTNLQVVDAICSALENLRPARDNPALRARGLDGYGQLRSFVADRPGHDRRYAIDSSKLQAELGWRPHHDFEQGIYDTVRWYLEHRDWCQSVQAGQYQRQRLGLGQPG